MGTLVKKIISSSSYLSLKTKYSAFCFSGFPKRACQGYHISKRYGKISQKIIVGKSAYQKSKTDVVRSHGHLSNTFRSTVSVFRRRANTIFTWLQLRSQFIASVKRQKTSLKTDIADRPNGYQFCCIPSGLQHIPLGTICHYINSW